MENVLVLNTPTRNELLSDGLLPRKYTTRDQILGRGAYGIVFKAIYRERSVAVKIISNHTECLQNERHALNLKHQNIVGILKVESTLSFGLVIMECPRGECLQRVLDTLKLPLPHRVFVTLDVLAALRYCHFQNLLHLDVKPANILVALDATPTDHMPMHNYKRNYVCKLCDFGSSVKITTEASLADQNSIKGTLRYMSPESLRSATLSAASDIYSLAITMWQMQMGCLPYHTLTCNEFIAYHVVKNELRPDNCAQFVALNNDFSYLSKAPARNCYAAVKNNTNLLDYNCENIDATRVRRKLNFEAKHSRVLKSRYASKGVYRKHQRLAKYFVNPLPNTNTCLEDVYQELYMCCWIGKPELRLSALQLQKCLELVLAEYFQMKC